MKGTPHKGSLVVGELKQRVQQIIWEENWTWSEYKKAGLDKHFVETRLHYDKMRLNGLVGVMDAMGYDVKIEIVKKKK